LHFKFLKSVK